jgi:uncharacterized protein YbbK (DUF523 family)
MPKILISACLLGQNVRYDGKNCLQEHAGLQALIKAGEVISICPEMAGGLPTPRPPAEIENGNNGLDVLNSNAKIITIHDEDVTAQFISGAQKTLALAKQYGIKVAILKARSPSCGSRQIYDGTHSGRIIDGMGITAALLMQNHIQVFDETQIDEAINAIK